MGETTWWDLRLLASGLSLKTWAMEGVSDNLHPLSTLRATEGNFTDRQDPFIFSSIQPFLLVEPLLLLLAPAAPIRLPPRTLAPVRPIVNSSGHSDWLCDGHVAQARPMGMTRGTWVLTGERGGSPWKAELGGWTLRQWMVIPATLQTVRMSVEPAEGKAGQDWGWESGPSPFVLLDPKARPGGFKF